MRLAGIITGQAYSTSLGNITSISAMLVYLATNLPWLKTSRNITFAIGGFQWPEFLAWL